MKEVTEQDVMNNGLNWLKTLDLFKMNKNDIWENSEVLRRIREGLRNDYNCILDKDFYNFKRKTSDEILNEKVEDQILYFKLRAGIEIKEYEIVDKLLLESYLGLLKIEE